MSVPDGYVAVYCVSNVSDEILAGAEGRTPVIYAMHRTMDGARASLAQLHAEHPDDTHSIRVMYMTPEQLADPDFPIPN